MSTVVEYKPVLPAQVQQLPRGYRLRPHEEQNDFYVHAGCEVGIGKFQITTEGEVVCACCGETLHSLRAIVVEA